MTLDTEMTIAKVRAWAKEMHEKGHELKLLWDGGGDSGWVHFEVDGEDQRGPEIDYLIDWCYDELDYGSWAGEFSAAGEAAYNPEEEAFAGIDWYSSEEYTKINDEDALIIQIPTSIKVDGLEVNIERQDDEAQTEVTIKVTNGFKVAAHTETEKAIAEQIELQYEKIVRAYSMGDKKYTPGGNNQVFSKDEMTLSEDGQHWIIRWDDVDIIELYEEDKSITLILTEENEDE